MEQNVNIESKNYVLIERGKDNIEDFLFDFNTSYSRREAAKNFDILDLVCIVGNIHLLPWTNAAEKVV